MFNSFLAHVNHFSAQIDKELATGEFFLRESEKRRKKMNEIKVRKFLTDYELKSRDWWELVHSRPLVLYFRGWRRNRLKLHPRDKNSGRKLSFPRKRSRSWRRANQVRQVSVLHNTIHIQKHTSRFNIYTVAS